jgi:hypothetical protein
VAGVEEVVAGQGDDDLGVAVGEDALVAVGSQAYQKVLMKGERVGWGCARGRACIDRPPRTITR